MKRILLFLFILTCSQLFGQNLEVSGTLVSSKDGAPLIGAHVSLLQPWGEAYKSAVSDANGMFFLEKVSKGGYRLKATYLGFTDFLQEVTLVDQSIDLGVLIVEEGGVLLDEVEVKELLPVATQEGDTTSYNAEAFKTLPDASAEDLVAKMPGVTVENGRISAQGENVQEVLVDGRKFFGNDPAAALKTLPADVISKIQVFDKQSEQAEFSGVQDGETTKTINIITKPNMRNGQFGKIYTGYGTDDRYQFGGNTSLFDGSRRISVIGQSNNVNRQNFSSEDLLGVTGSSGRRGGRGGGGGHGGRGGGAGDFLVDQQGGISKTHALGINYSDQWGEKIEISGSYFFNFSDNLANEISNTQYIGERSGGELYNEDYSSETQNTNHRANLRITYDLSERSSFIIRPRITIQKNDGLSVTDGMTSLEGTLFNESDVNYLSDLSGVNIQNDLLFRHRFPKKGRTFSISLRNAYNDNKGDSYLDSRNTFYRDPIEFDTLDQFTDLLTEGWNHSANFNYTEPLGEATSLNLSYRASIQDEQSDRETMDRSLESGEYEILNTTLSNVFENQYITHSAGLGFNYRKGRDLFGMVRASVQASSLRSDETFPNLARVERNFFNLVPFAMLRYNISQQKNLRIFYRSNTQSPSVSQLQNVINNSNPLQLSAGNPDLDQSYSHRLFMRYTSSNIDKASVFFILVSGSLTQDYVGNATFLSRSDHPIFDEYEIERGSQLTIPVNMDGYGNLRVFTTYGVPLKGLKTNINLEVSANYTRIPGMIDDVSNFSNNRSLTTGVTFASNISEKVDFTIGARVGYNNVNNTIRDELNDIYWTQNSRAKIGVIFPAGFVLRSDVTHQLYRGLSETFNEDYFLWNIAIGKKLFKNELGEISLSVFDLLKQNQNIQRNITETYIEDQRINVLQQYFMLNFTYNFRNFKTKKAAPERSEEESRRRMPFH